MKTRILALFAFALLTLGVTAQKAQAQTFTCDGGSNPVPAMVTGNAVVEQSTSCTIANGITATGSIDIQISGGTLNVGAALNAGTSAAAVAPGNIVTASIAANNGSILVTSSTAKVTTTTLTSVGGDIGVNAAGNLATQTVNAGSNFGAFSTGGTVKVTGTVTATGNVLMQAFGNLGVTSTITSSIGAVELDPYYQETSSTVFSLGGGGADGVGAITAPLGVLVVNGNPSSAGGITITNGNKINVQNPSAATPGSILLNAQNGTLTLTAGKLSADGATGQSARLIVLLANNVTAGSGTTITASQANTVAASIHYISIAANSLTVGGTTIEANGNGASGNPAQVDLAPPGYVSFMSNETLDFLEWNVVAGTNIFELNEPFTVNGAGALTVKANGSTSNVEIPIGGYPIVFNNGGDVTLQTTGNGIASAPQIQLGYLGSLNGTPGLTFNNTGAVLIDANGTSGNDAGGQIHIQLDQFSVASSVTSFTMEANGLGTGNAGIVGFFPSSATFSDATTLFSANGAGSTSVSSPNINYGVNNGTTVNSTSFAVSANALASQSESAGIITLSSNPLTLGSANTSATLTANGPTSTSKNGAGGTITLNPAFLGPLKLGNNPGDLSLSATGGAGTGSGNNGGTIIIGNAPEITLDTAQATALNVSVPGHTGNGGTITISDWTFTVNGSGYALDANAGTTNGNGGNITINGAGTTIGSGAGALKISANGTGTGNGGMISVTAQPLTVDGASISANAGSTNGNGGSLTLDSSGGTGVLTLSGGTLAANGTGNGNGGQISLTGSQSVATDGTAPVSISANAAGSGNGGSITLNSASGNLSIGSDNSSFSLTANSGASGGNGGSITINAPSTEVSINNASLSVAAMGNGNGGTVNVLASQDFSMVGNMAANAAGNGDAGSITVIATGNMTFTGSGQFISVNAPGTGNGGQINLTAGGNIDVDTSAGSIELSSANTCGGGCMAARPATQISPRQTTSPAINVKSTNNGGSINCTALTITPGTGQDGATVTGNYSSSVTLTGACNANANSNGDGNGGTITVTSTGGTINAQDITFTADGSGSGNGGQISLTAMSSSSALDLTNATLSASGAADGSGNGNQILIVNAAGDVTLAQTKLNATGGGNGGNGGNITIKTPANTESATYFVDYTTASINAGANSTSDGQGGFVTIPNAEGAPDDFVLAISVDGGANNQTANDGAVALNGLTCTQFTTSLAPFPLIYWNCLSGATPTGYELNQANFAHTLPSGIQSLLDAQNNTNYGIQKPLTQLLVFQNGTDYSTFFQPQNAINNDVEGVTFFAGDESRIYSAVMERGNIRGQYVSLDSENVSESAAHELGHSVDFAKGTDSHSVNFQKGFNNDLLYLDYVGGNQSDPAPTCSSNNTAPFDGVIDATNGNYICDPTTHVSEYPNDTNSLILQVTTPELFLQSQVINPLNESYAQIFSFQSFVSNSMLNPSGEFFLQTIDGVLNQKVSGQTNPPFFTCSQGWLSGVLGGSLTTPSYCTNAKPGWYTPYQSR